ncbi:MAG: hypothetical protein UZ19_OD1000274 [Parcubacteria bacterium OLB19]|jgi:hypothetical protein|nr:MAG: hypothetical protein UZ19_OD1000274 [Parcubacteria bacterium OLB19]
MPKYEVKRFSESYLTGDKSVFGPQLSSGVAEEIGNLVDDVLEIQQIVFGLSTLYRNLPKGKFSTILYPGIIPFDPLPDAINVSFELESPNLFVAGHHLGYPVGFNDSEVDGRTRKYLSLDNIKDVLNQYLLARRGPGFLNPKVFTQVHAQHTGQQAEWVAQQVQASEAEAVVIMATSGHITRAFLTQLMAFAKIGVEVPIIPVPHAINPCSRIVPNMSQNHVEDEDNAFTQAEFSLSEWYKILNYTNDVAGLAILKKYCQWLAEYGSFRYM